MLELLANGPENGQRISYPLEVGTTYVLGRDTGVDLPVPWDMQISRRHVEIAVAENAVDVVRLPEARNPLYYNGAQHSSARVPANRHFVIGETMFLVMPPSSSTVASGNGEPIREVTFDRTELEKVRFRDADKRINVLANLPEVIAGARTESELFDRLGKLILAGVPHADAAAILQVPPEGPPRVRHWERRRETAGEFRPSKRLVIDAVREKRRTVLHLWDTRAQQAQDYTQAAEFDWAFCAPVTVHSGENWGLYVTGRTDLPPIAGRSSGHERHLDADVKFTELVAEIISAVRRVNVLERERAGFRQFFAPAVLTALEDNPELLEPRESDVTVLFCDLRGFSRKAEAAGSDLLGLLDRVSRALEIMTEQILKFGGVTADFMGDAALGFWGWPISSTDAPLDACRAALGIRAAFDAIRADENHPLSDFSMGIGIAFGPAVAGKIGTRDQVKVSVFGPVVNLASRLEGMTKQLRVPIVMDDATATLVRRHLEPAAGRVRRLGTVQPYGMESPVKVSELVPPLSQCPHLTDELLALYDRGVEYFESGDWEEAHRCFHKMPEDDRAQDFPGIRIAQHNRVAPRDWDGVVQLASK